MRGSSAGLFPSRHRSRWVPPCDYTPRLADHPKSRTSCACRERLSTLVSLGRSAHTSRWPLARKYVLRSGAIASDFRMLRWVLTPVGPRQLRRHGLNPISRRPWRRRPRRQQIPVASGPPWEDPQLSFVSAVGMTGTLRAGGHVARLGASGRRPSLAIPYLRKSSPREQGYVRDSWHVHRDPACHSVSAFSPFCGLLRAYRKPLVNCWRSPCSPSRIFRAALLNASCSRHPKVHSRGLPRTTLLVVRMIRHLLAGQGNERAEIPQSADQCMRGSMSD